MAKKEQNSKENTKNKKSFFKSFKAELKKVTWLTPKQLVNNTTAVIVIVLLTAIIVFILNVAFEAMNEKGIDQLRKVISNSTQTTNESSDESATNEVNESTNESTNTSEQEQNTEAESTNQTDSDVQGILQMNKKEALRNVSKRL